MKVDILYLAWNREAFTEFTFAKLLANTDWDQVSRLIVYDDGSEDGTREYLDEAIKLAPVPTELRFLGLGSPVATMKNYLATTQAEMFAKVDNDLAVSPGWLDAMLGVMERHPELELLGMEPSFMMPPPVDWDGVYTYTPWKHIGGNGLMKVSAFRKRRAMDVDGLHGFTGWQWNTEPRRGFVTPDLQCCLLDRAPIEPWLTLSAEYVANGWQRPWGKISESYPYYYEWLGEQVAA